MKKQLLVAGVAALAVTLGTMCALAGTEVTVTLDKVPAGVRATIEKHAGDAKVQKVEIITSENGKQVYDVEIQKGGKTTEFSVAPDGKYLGIKADEDATTELAKSVEAAKPSTKITADKLPPAVMKAFKKAYPKGEFQKLDAEEENGVMVYDIEFKDGTVEKECDIAADGTMLEYTIVIEMKDAPEAVEKAFQKGAAGAKMGRMERIEISYETKGGKIIKLAKPLTQYAVEITKDGKTSEITVNPDGSPVAEEKPAPKK
jgi:uncharacterized membrane protein YkoI